jgi:hypothetical protein
VVLGGAMAISATLGLWLTRGTTFFADELTYFVANRGFDLRALLSGHNGHLIAGTRLIYATVLKLFGSGYVPFRILEVLGVVLVSGLFFILAKRRIGAAAALAPSVVLLFLGSSGEVTVTPLGITHVYSVATGLGALLALERRDRWGDVGACALVTVSAATFTIGLAFLAGITVSVLLREDRWRRAWIFAIPIALYFLWFVAAPELSGPAFSKSSGVRLSNVLLIPNFVADAGASIAAALSGLFYFSNSPSDTISSPWGNVIVAVALLGLILALRRGRPTASLWVSLAVPLGFWIPIALTEPGRPPGAIRYIYAGSVAVLLVVTDAARGLRLSHRELLGLLGAAILALGANISAARNQSGALRTEAAQVRAQLTAIQLARDRVDPAFVPGAGPLQSITQNPNLAARAGPLLAAVDRVGSFAFSLAELERQAEPVRELADSTLAGALRLGLTPVPPPIAGQKCVRIGGRGATPLALALHPPGVELRASIVQPVTLARFGTVPSAIVGILTPGVLATLAIPVDRATKPWRVVFPGAHPLTVCALR